MTPRLKQEATPRGRAWRAGAMGAILAWTLGAVATPDPQCPLEIITDRAEAAIFPTNWLDTSIQARATLLEPAEQPAAHDVIARALAKYPPDLLRAHLDRVYVLGGLEFRGVSAGGTSSLRAIYVVGRNWYVRTDLERNVHAEISSILWRNGRVHFDAEAWRRNNPSNFLYRGTGVQAIGDGQASRRLDEKLHPFGFLYEYARAELEEDFNSLASGLFTGDTNFWRAVECHPPLRAKADLAIAFYTALDPRLTPEYFHGLARAAQLPAAPHR